MKLTIVGCSGSFPGPESPASCYLLEYDGYRLVLDMGNGSLGSLSRHADLYGLDGVVFSHLHIDHCADLCSYYVARKYHPDGPLERVPVFGPAGTSARMMAIDGFAGNRELRNEFDFTEFDQNGSTKFEVGPFQIQVTLMCHVVDSYAVRVDAGGRSLVYSGDTGPCPQLIEAAADADVALFEASFLEGADNPPDLHLTGADAARAALRAGVGRLVLTHLVPWHDSDRVLADAQGVWSGDILLAKAGMTLEV